MTGMEADFGRCLERVSVGSSVADDEVEIVVADMGDDEGLEESMNMARGSKRARLMMMD